MKKYIYLIAVKISILNILFCSSISLHLPDTLKITINDKIISYSCSNDAKALLILIDINITIEEYILFLKFDYDDSFWGIRHCPNFSLNEISSSNLENFEIVKLKNNLIKCKISREYNEILFNGFMEFGNDISYSLIKYDEYA